MLNLSLGLGLGFPSGASGGVTPVPIGYNLFRVKQAAASHSDTFQVKQADGSYRRFIVKAS